MTMQISFPNSDSTTTPPRPLLPNRFWVELEGVMEAFFTECTGLQIITEVFEYKEGGVNGFTHKLPVRTSFSNITLKHGLTNSDKLWKWYMATAQGKLSRQNISIILYSALEPGKEVLRWNIDGAYPIKWTGPDFKTSDAQAHAIETIELVHRGFTLNKG